MIFLDNITPFERIRISGALASKLATLQSDLSPLARVRVAREVAELLQQLGVKSDAQGRRLAFMLGDKETSATALSDYLDNGLNDLPASLAPFEAATVIDLAISVGSKDIAEEAQLMQRLQLRGGIDAAHLAAYEKIASRGVKPGIDTASVLRKVVESEDLLRQSAASDPGFANANAEIERRNERFRAEKAPLQEAIAAERSAIQSGQKSDSAELAALQERYTELVEQYRKDYEVLKDIAVAAIHSFEQEKAQKAMALLKDEGEAVLLAIMAASPVTEKQAADWAARQVVDDKAWAKLARLGYKKADLYRDLAEFYRLTGGKSSAIRISTDGGRRANAVGVMTRLDEKVINLGSRFDKTVLFHELAHHLENDPIAKAASNGFLVKRRESSTIYSLKSLTGQNYRSDEGAYKDSFLDAYIGKVYGDGVTEVFSMGMQYLANPKDAAVLAARDPEMFALISGYLSSELTPAMHAKLNMHAGAIDDLQARRQDENEQYAQALTSLAGQVTLTRDGWWDDLQARDSYMANWLADFAFIRNKPPKYLGAYGNYRVFEGVFRNKNTSRNAKGYTVIRTPLEGAIPDYAALHGSLDLLKSFIVIAEEQGLRLSSVWYNVFFEAAGRDPKQTIIRSANSILGALP